MPNYLLQFYYFKLESSVSGDDHSNYCRLLPYLSTNAENFAHANLHWCVTFGIFRGLVLDSQTQFKNIVRIAMKILRLF